MISIPEGLKKKLTSCRRNVSRLTVWNWNIDRAVALRSELNSLNGELFDLFPEDEEIPTEITDKVFYYNDLLESYIRSLKSSDFGFMVPSIRFSNVIPLDVSTRSMDCTKHISIPEVHVKNVDAVMNEPEPESSSLFGVEFPSRENCSIEIREKTSELQCSIMDFKNDSSLLLKTESNDDVDFMKEAEEIVGGADLAMNCLSYHPDFGEFMIMFTNMNTNDDVVTDFPELDPVKTRSGRIVIIGKFFDPYGFDPWKLKFRLLYRLVIHLVWVAQVLNVFVGKVKSHLKVAKEFLDLKMYLYLSAVGENYGIMCVFVYERDIGHVNYVSGDLLYRIHPIFSGLITFWSDSNVNFYRLDSLPNDQYRQVAILLKMSMKIIYVLNLLKSYVNGSNFLVDLFYGIINAKRFLNLVSRWECDETRFSLFRFRIIELFLRYFSYINGCFHCILFS